MHVDSITTAPLLEGLAGTRQTLNEMAKLVRKDSGSLPIRQYALEIASRCQGHDFDCEVRAVFHYCRDQIIYRRDPVENEWVQDAARTIGVFGSGDCDDKVVCLATLLGALGHKSRFVVVGKKPDHYSHVYLEVQTKHGWLSLDPTPERAPLGWQARGMHRDSFEIWGRNETGGALFFVAAGALLWWLLK
jgi:transglutaminase-like putative cysteine protease